MLMHEFTGSRNFTREEDGIDFVVFSFSLKLTLAKTADIMLSRQKLHNEVCLWAQELEEQTGERVAWRYDNDYYGTLIYTVYGKQPALLFKLRFC